MPSHMNCCFNKCTNSSRSTQNLSFHKFPTNESLCKQWVELCQNDKVIQKFKNHGSSQVSKSFRICSEHFKREDYVLWTSKKKVLHKGSIPTGQLISPKTTHTNMATWSEMITEDDEVVANNTGWSPRGTPNFDLTGSGGIVEKKWKHLKDPYIRTTKGSKLKSGDGMANKRKHNYIYHDQVQLMTKTNIPRQTISSVPELHSEENVKLESPNTEIKFQLNPGEKDEHEKFFDSMLSVVRHFDIDQTLAFRAEMINVIQKVQRGTIQFQQPPYEQFHNY